MSTFGELKFFVSLQVYQMKQSIFITQSKYIKEILKYFGMEDSKSMGTPIVTGHKLSKNENFADVNQTQYKSMIGKLQYVIQSKPNIALAIGIVSRFLASPKVNHMMAVKRILRYLKGTKDWVSAPRWCTKRGYKWTRFF